ncbi:SDR family oxidoreductase [Sphingobium sp. TCM1]|uniref:SDR family oxidoreductase n=1 Tax=Sphingobium sp. TCM1 TaxID=453246 RepID=UPI0007F4DEEA|nr:SDR family NAD(P)-dependent oxidoreductase [Sphingobium sp. TCM1]OAN59313.1 short-chain dehydrogenase [Sphingobium sp. TCM1]
MGSLAGKVALVTGASSGIGEAAASALAGAGAAVALSARRVDRLGRLVDRIRAAGGEAIALPGNVAVEVEAMRAVTDTVDRFGRIDILVNSAGVIQSGGVESLSLDEWRRVIDINLLGTLYTCKAAIGSMKAQGGGDIINISSTAGRRAAGLFGPYSTSKFGLTGLTESLRQEVGGAGIRVAIVEPGATATEVAGGISDPTMRAAMTDHVGKDSAMQPEDIAQAILFITALPARANVSQILIRPTADTAAM